VIARRLSLVQRRCQRCKQRRIGVGAEVRKALFSTKTNLHVAEEGVEIFQTTGMTLSLTSTRN